MRFLFGETKELLQFCITQHLKQNNKIMDKKIPYKIYLTEDEIPTQWYNVRADMKNKPAPLINPGTGQPQEVVENRGLVIQTQSLLHDFGVVWMKLG